MTSESPGNSSTPMELLVYWIEERTRILTKRLSGEERPWSDDPVFQTTYFTNVRREDDKTTKFVRSFYAPYFDDPMYEYNVVFSRFVNWPPTIYNVGYMQKHEPERIIGILGQMVERHEQVWSGAYIITTHGLPMPKATYLAENVLGGLSSQLDKVRSACRGVGQPLLLSHAHTALMGLEGLGSFLAAQVVADLKNTQGHPLQHAPDWWSFVAPGPGSIRGLNWFHGKTSRDFLGDFLDCREYVDEHLNHTLVPKFCNQDMQNCLCEFDKMMRVRNGTGRSKRNYKGGAE